MAGDCILIRRMFAAGDTFGPYTIVKRLGAGAMGEVYQARHRHMGREAAIKVLRAELTEDTEVVNRFFTEARATAAVRHPGIVEIFDCDLHRSGRAFIVMEYLAGEDLARRLQFARSFAGDWPAVRSIGRQLASALGAAHAAGIVHRDLKPGNIFLVGEAPTVKVVDFGIAKLMNRGGGEHSLTQTGHILGTPLYMSPEQARGAKTIDHRTDIYALGCVLLEMITGKPPFVRKGPADVLVAHLHDPAPRASSLEPTVPAALDELVASMLAKNPDERPRSMADVVARLAEPAAPAPGRIATQLMGSGKPSPAPAPQTAAPAPAVPASPAPAASVGASPPGTAVGRPAAKDGPAVAVRAAAPAAAATRAGFAGREAQVVSRAGDTTLGKSAGELVAVDERDDAPARPASRRTGLVVAAAAVVVVGGAAAFFARSAGGPRAAAPAPAVSAPAAPAAPVALAALPSPANARIAFTSQPPGASVWVGAEPSPRGTTPLTIELPAGAPPTQVVLRAEGHEPATLTLDGKDTSARHVVLPPVAAAPAPAAVPAPAAPPASRHHHEKKPARGEFRAIED
jgi:serine/threonine-protein kinase